MESLDSADAATNLFSTTEDTILAAPTEETTDVTLDQLTMKSKLATDQDAVTVETADSTEEDAPHAVVLVAADAAGEDLLDAYPAVELDAANAVAGDLQDVILAEVSDAAAAVHLRDAPHAEDSGAAPVEVVAGAHTLPAIEDSEIVVDPVEALGAVHALVSEAPIRDLVQDAACAVAWAATPAANSAALVALTVA